MVFLLFNKSALECNFVLLSKLFSKRDTITKPQLNL